MDILGRFGSDLFTNIHQCSDECWCAHEDCMRWLSCTFASELPLCRQETGSNERRLVMSTICQPDD